MLQVYSVSITFGAHLLDLDFLLQGRITFHGHFQFGLANDLSPFCKRAIP